MDYQYNNYAPSGFDFNCAAERREEMYKEKKELRRLGNLSGLGMVLFIGFQFLSLLILLAAGLEDAYLNDPDATYAIGTVVSVFSIFIPFLITWLCLGESRKICLCLGKPYDTGMMLAAVPIGLMLCMIGNFSTYYFSAFFENAFGIVFEAPEMEMPTSPLGIAAYFLQIAVVPALVEEFAVRGVVMMPLRKYGNLFAIVISAAIFGIMHGNLVQAPFAFIVGLGIGYLVIATGSMWTGVLIHFCNNFFSAAISLAGEYLPDETVNIIYYTWVAAFLISGILCAIVFVRRAKEKGLPIKFKRPGTRLTAWQKTVAYLVNVPMLLAFGYLIYTTAQYTRFI